jgi:Protein of unknown function (DUF3455)
LLFGIHFNGIMTTKLLLLIFFLAVIQTVVGAGCPLNNVPPPVNNPSAPLNAPSPGLSLKFVALGRGTQNYTCSNANSTDTPTAIGAVATLYDASCLATLNINLLNGIPPILLEIPSGETADIITALDQIASPGGVSFVLAQHYFVTDTTPFFDFRPFGNPDWIEAKKLQSVAAPPGSVPGSVPWLQLGYVAGYGINVSDSRITKLFNNNSSLTSFSNRKSTVFIRLVGVLPPLVGLKRALLRSNMQQSTGSMDDSSFYPFIQAVASLSQQGLFGCHQAWFYFLALLQC